MPKIIRFLSIISIILLSITFFNALYLSDVSSEKNISACLTNAHFEDIAFRSQGTNLNKNCLSAWIPTERNRA